MAVIHRTTMNPGKLELLSSWLPSRPWYVPTEPGPELARAGGFRLDDPRGEVGIEFMVVTDGSGDDAVAYHLPLTYRGAPLDGAEHALVGTAEHGVLGRRWVYDGTHDPVLAAQLLALLEGRAEPQAQSESDTPDPTVTRHFRGPGGLSAPKTAEDGPEGTDLLVEARGGGDSESAASRLTLTVTRVLRAEGSEADGVTAGTLGGVTAGWRTPEGHERRGSFVLLRDPAR